MADRVSASIVLGGTINSSAFAELVALIEQEGLSINWDEEPFLREAVVSGQPLHLCAHEVAWGQFEYLENWCLAHSLPFCRRSDAHGAEWNAERIVFTGSAKSRSFTANADGHVVIDRDAVERLGSIKAIKAYFDAADFIVPPLVVVEAT